MKEIPPTEIHRQFNALKGDWECFKNSLDAFFSALESHFSAPEVGEKLPSPSAIKSKPAKAAKQQSGNFPYPVGILVRVAFPEMFKRKAISAGDIAYLLSKKAADDFLTRGSRVIKLYTTDNDPSLYQSGHRRYYKIPPMELGAKKYHLTSQFFPESREPVLKWIYQHGLKKNELIHIIESAAMLKK